MRRLSRISAALAVVAAPLFLAGPAMADFTYSTLTTPASQAFGAASTAQFGATSSLSNLFNSQGISLVTIADQTTATSPTDTGSVPFSDVITITQTPGHGSTGSGSGTLTLTGTINWTRSDTGGQISTFTFTNVVPPTLTIGNTTYSLTGFIYAQPTVNVPLTSTDAGSISGNLSVVAVPEPSSVAALCVGGLLVAAPRLRRLARRTAKS
jgi:hypothetical protein